MATPKPTKKTGSRIAGPAPGKQRTTGFPIVGIGASAGGLEAFEAFFHHMQPDSGLAFVLVPHLDPEHASLLTEILQRATTMAVIEAADQMTVEPNHVYVIPPNRDMAIFHGALQLSVPEQPRGQRMPIDAFLRSLAEDQGEQAIGIILSGTATDGTLGLRAILGAGGISLVQEPATAKYDGMPTSAIRNGYATHILAPEKMPETLLADTRGLAVSPAAPPSPAPGGGINAILMQLRSGTGHDFSQYKKSTIGRRIERRMLLHSIDSIEVYAQFLKKNPAEVKTLFQELLINVTSFFRDGEAFAALKQDVLPHLLAGKPEGYMLRIWVAGCATGEEAYSIAITLRELMDEFSTEFKVQLYGTDLDDEAIAVARIGVYPPNIAQDMTPERLKRFFVKEEAGYRIKKEIREMVVFATQNVIKDPPFTRLDLLSCRNLMIYLEPELQSRLIPQFHYALKPGGVLFLSPSESIGNHTMLFKPLNRKLSFFQAIHSGTPTTAATGALSWTASNVKEAETDHKKPREPNFADLTRQALLQSYAPASVVTDLKGNILFVHGETGKYLRPPPGQATLNVVEMAHDGLQAELRTALLSAAGQGTHTLDREVSIKTGAGMQVVHLSVRPLADADRELLLVSFQDIAPAVPARHGKRVAGPSDLQRIEDLECELAYSKKNLQATIEEMQSGNEELKSANEELQSTNEELQSSNEELETSKEELQSVNEELVTVNTELQAKIEQLADMQNDMKNLLDNISAGIIFLDERMTIRSFTREATRIYRLVASDTGRPLGDIKCDCEADDLLDQARRVLDTLIPYEQEVRTADGTWYLARIQPYRTLDNVIGGVVLTFTDITERLRAIAAQEARELAEKIVDTVREPLLVLDAGLRVISASRSFYRAFRTEPQATLGRTIQELGDRQWDIPALCAMLESILSHDRAFEDYVVEHDFPALGRRTMRLNGRRIVGKPSETALILLAIEEADIGASGT